MNDLQQIVDKLRLFSKYISEDEITDSVSAKFDLLNNEIWINTDALERFIGTNSNVKFDTAITDFYHAVFQCHFFWMLNEQNEQMAKLDFDIEATVVGGNLNIVNLPESYNSFLQKEWPQKLNPYNEIQDNQAVENLLHKLFPFDYLSSDLAVCFKYEEYEVKDQLYLIDFTLPNKIVPLNIGILDYINTGIEYGFFIGWQKAIYLKDDLFMTRIEYFKRVLFE